MDIGFRELPPVRVAYMRHVGPYGSEGIPLLWQHFAAWCEAQGLMSPRRVMYGQSLDDPSSTPPERCRYDACVEVDADYEPGIGEVGVQTIGGGRFACLPFEGTAHEIGRAFARLIGEIVAQGSVTHADHRPAIEIYGTDFAVDDNGVFHCELCLPITP